jgi:hypothetical protein
VPSRRRKITSHIGRTGRARRGATGTIPLGRTTCPPAGCASSFSQPNPIGVETAGDGGQRKYDHIPKELEVYLQQYVREVGPRIVVGLRPTGEPKVKLLPEEALHLGEGLIRLATMANNDSKLVKCEPCVCHEA